MLGTPDERAAVIATLEREGVDYRAPMLLEWQEWIAAACGVTRARLCYHVVAERIARGQYAETWARLERERTEQAAAGAVARAAGGKAEA